MCFSVQAAGLLHCITSGVGSERGELSMPFNGGWISILDAMAAKCPPSYAAWVSLPRKKCAGAKTSFGEVHFWFQAKSESSVSHCKASQLLTKNK